ncbi:hypothetical protein SAY86_023664 [Trapa natans]|uniref:Uncharacterized protein n=1 Tax=Trapa natans TaxID=22666 RepID=A0AAN7LXP5_TRANT|nr:hypothetical protein SAY86_023664 [Trapa natans]
MWSASANGNLEANSPIRTLDELTVTEVASSPYFPQSNPIFVESFVAASSSLALSLRPTLGEEKIVNPRGSMKKESQPRSLHTQHTRENPTISVATPT